MHPMLTIAKRAADEAGRIIQDGFRQLDQIKAQEKAPGDFVSVIDQHAERAIVRVLQDKFPDHAFLTEEGGEIEPLKKNAHYEQYTWVIDPLDGTANFLHGLAQFAVSIALLKNNRLEVGLVYNPINGELFTAARGQGAQVSGRRLRVNAAREAKSSVIGTGFPFKERQHMSRHLAIVDETLKHCSDLRRLGSAALDLCFVAAGRLDGFFEIGLQPWDMAAGILIAQEAGALVSDFDGKGEMMNCGEVVCAPQNLHKLLLSCIEKGRA